MKTLILYITKHGCTEKIANMLKARIGEDVYIRNLKNDYSIDLNLYDNVIIGSSIHMGKIPRRMKKFCKENAGMLLNKRLGLYISCMFEGDVASKQLADAYPQILKDASIAFDFLGGEFNFKKMNFIDKLMVKKVANVTESVCRIDNEKVIQFAEKFC
ncbi:MAG: flavodoxin domain-containing protein [Bacteroidota bacterium]